MTIPAGRQTAPSATFALDYTRRGWPVVPVPLREKGPRILDWQKLRITPEMVPSYFTEPSNIGVILGDGLVDVDLDCIEALAISDEVLPQTGSVFGRATTPRAHRLYYVDGPAPT